MVCGTMKAFQAETRGLGLQDFSMLQLYGLYRRCNGIMEKNRATTSQGLGIPTCCTVRQRDR